MKILSIAGSVALLLHGLVHLLGAAAYTRAATISQLPYKTTVLAGRVDLGPTGTFIYGSLWAVAALGFIAVGIGTLASLPWWRSVLVPVAMLSLLLTVLDYQVAYAGIAVNVAIVAYILFQ